MPKENISDITQERWRAEVSWRPEERVCHGCLTVWQAPVPDCPECGRKDVPITSGHVQVASVNLDSPFEFHAESTAAGLAEAEPFDGWRVTLDADQIDHLITVLRKARRQAFPQHHSAHAGRFSSPPDFATSLTDAAAFESERLRQQ